MNKVTIEDIECNTGYKIENKNLLNKINSSELNYEYLTFDEFQYYILDFIKILKQDLTRAGKSRLTQWENGWNENLEEFRQTKNVNSLIPKYHKKHKIARLNSKIINTYSADFDYHIHSYFVDSVLLHYIKDYNKIFEFGCGTGYHLFRLNEYHNDKQYCGLDWTTASQDNIKCCSNILDITNIQGKNFDYFNPDYTVDIKDSLIYTIASLEQIGWNYTELLKYIINKKPALCIHFEPIHELLDKDDLMDYLTTSYFRKRDYLSNYLNTLRVLEKQNKIKIIEAKRLNYGSKFVEGHSLIIWKPL